MGAQTSELRSALLSVLTGLGLGPNSCVYVSTPISTGARYLKWLEESGMRIRPGSDEYEVARRGVKNANLDAAQALIARAREIYPRYVVIDPTALADINGWQQKDYHLYWMEVISKYVHTMIFAKGWQYSEGCAVEFAAASDAHITALDHHNQPIDPVSALMMINGAIDKYIKAGVNSKVLNNVTTILQKRQEPAGNISAESSVYA